MAVPGQVTGVAVSKDGSRRFYLSYNKVVGSGYYIYLSSDSGVTYTLIKHVDDDDEIDTQIGRVEADTEYYIKVSAFNDDGEGLASVPITYTTLAEDIKSAWVGGDKKNYDANSMYLEEDQNIDSLRGEGTLDITLKLDDLGTPDDNTDLNATTSRHGLLKKLSGIAGDFLNGDGNWAVPESLPGGESGQFQYNGSGNLYGTGDLIINTSLGLVTAYLFAISHIKSGATQAAAGASAGEIWKTASHATLPDNVLMIGV